ncbi:MAG: hypothetical protein ACLFUO_05570, partial [Candidatus Woesearchaeota archaeon]
MISAKNIQTRISIILMILLSLVIFSFPAYADSVCRNCEKSTYFLLTELKDMETDEYIHDGNVRIEARDGSYSQEHHTSDTPENDPRIIFYDVPSDTFLDAEYSSPGYLTDDDDYYFDSRLDSCVGPFGSTCTLEQPGYVTECENYEANNRHYLYCSLYSNDQSIAFIYSPEYNVIGVGNLMVCIDSDGDGICDKDEDNECIGDNASNVPDDTSCRDWSFDSETGCHVFDDDPGISVCDPDYDSEQVCMPDNAFGDVYQINYERYCGNETGQCDGNIVKTGQEMVQECTDSEECLDGECISCFDYDNDGVCDNKNDDCLFEGPQDLKQNTTCFKNWFNYNTGCIEEQ